MHHLVINPSLPMTSRRTPNMLTILSLKLSLTIESSFSIWFRAALDHSPPRENRTSEISQRSSSTNSFFELSISKMACVTVNEVVWMAPKLTIRIRPGSVSGSTILKSGCTFACSIDHCRKILPASNSNLFFSSSVLSWYKSYYRNRCSISGFRIS